ncbi:diguanylate cyclase [Actinotalea sp. K2]|uniref:histidine kinase N-terminal 7TM domain-containing diguanylate cyclase n=1 Tax=Actinotalea sp. K2 TaxID=2939438 RepID=UPI002016D1DC|nr:diguanylate cyclase [Actinotalea sp. K2]MCL3862893.1 diguanylate cyclase [Actinotalea sp. K2]
MPTIVEIVSLLAAVLATSTAVRVWSRRRTSPLALPLSLMLVGASQWSVARSLLTLASTPEAAVLLNYAIYPGVAVVVGASFWYFLVLAGQQTSLTPRVRVLLCIHPVLLFVALVTDPWHRLFLQPSTTAAGVVTVDVGPLYWLHTAYSYTLLVVGFVVVFRAMRRAVRGHRHVYAVSLVAAAVPFAGNVITQFVTISARGLHLTPVLFLVSAAIWWWVERFGNRDGLVPVQARQVLAALTDAVVVLDHRGVVVDANPAARRLLRAFSQDDGARVVGAGWHEVAGGGLARVALVPGEVTQVVDGGTVTEVRVTEMTADRAQHLGSVVVLRDVTEVVRLRDELAEQAVRDGLTGLHNRRHLEVVLADAVARAAAEGFPLSAVMVDIDHFKQVNDGHGHAVGDQVLLGVATILADGVRNGDTVARFGGEEFVLLLPGVGAHAAAERAEAWRRLCSDLAVDTPDGPVTVTISVGVAELPAGSGPDELLRLADDALYAAKAAGRDVVVVHADSALSTGDGMLRA